MKMIIMSFLSRLKKNVIILRYCYLQWRDKEKTEYLKALKIMSMDDTLEYVITNRCSMTRYGDGEFLVMGGGGNGFQKEDEKLATRLRQVLKDPLPNLLICIPSFLKDVSPFLMNTRLTCLGFNDVHLKDCVMPYVPITNVYGEALVTRFYMAWRSKKHVDEHIKRLKNLWDKEDLLIVEGYGSRLGVGNSLFANAKSISRILCPQENAFDVYDNILNEVKKHSHRRLVILALGMTATILAYDLSKEGIRALDLGHVDVEYEWFKMKATRKVPIPNKVMAEVVGGKDIPKSNDREYLGQILSRV
ncbi:MAG: GT-D fold domain-containing glycosyltransferase [Prevotellamassilia sp.]|nr:GT-D fold domain-containing glycosyltransferase [Prevotellamassilia sp.]